MKSLAKKGKDNVMIRDPGASPPLPITGMPAGLVEVVNEYDLSTRRIIRRNWVLIGEEGRRRYRERVEAASPRTRRKRCELVLKDLYQAAA